MSGWFSNDKTADEIDKLPAYSNTTAKYANLFWLKPDDEIKVVFLDDKPKITFYYHSLFIKGDKTAIKMRVACKDGSSSEANPIKCPICNAALHDEAIGRRFGSLVTVIDLTGYTDKEGKQRKHLRRVMLLSHKETKKMNKIVKQEGGSIRGLQVVISRSDKKSSVNGDHWHPKKKLGDIEKAFSKSVGAKYLYSAKKKAGEEVTPSEAVKLFLTPADYQALFEPSDERVNNFLTYRGHDPEEMSGKKSATKKKNAPDVDFSVDSDDGDGDLIDDDGLETSDSTTDEVVEDSVDSDFDDDGLEDDGDEVAEAEEEETEEIEEEEAPEQPKKTSNKSPKKTGKKGTAKKTAAKKTTTKKKEAEPELDDFDDDLAEFDEP